MVECGDGGVALSHRWGFEDFMEARYAIIPCNPSAAPDSRSIHLETHLCR